MHGSPAQYIYLAFVCCWILSSWRKTCRQCREDTLALEVASSPFCITHWRWTSPASRNQNHLKSYTFSYIKICLHLAHSQYYSYRYSEYVRLSSLGTHNLEHLKISTLVNRHTQMILLCICFKSKGMCTQINIYL